MRPVEIQSNTSGRIGSITNWPISCPKEFAELTVHARAKLRRTQRRKTLIAAFWKQAELPI